MTLRPRAAASWGLAVSLLGALACAPQSAGPAAPTVPKAAAPASDYARCSEVAGEPKGAPARAAVSACRAAAEQGSATAAFVLSLILRQNPDLPDANGWVSWCERAAALNHPIAQYMLAMHALSQGNRPRARDLLEKSACTGFPPALEAVRRTSGAGDVILEACSTRESFDGDWEGTLAIAARDLDRGHPQEPLAVRLAIKGNDVGVKMLLHGAWVEIKAGTFQIRRHKENAVIHAVDDGWDSDGNWVETWAFSLTFVDHDRLRALYHRVVNNVYMPRTEDQAIFWYTAAGDLKRTVP